MKTIGLNEWITSPANLLSVVWELDLSQMLSIHAICDNVMNRLKNIETECKLWSEQWWPTGSATALTPVQQQNTGHEVKYAHSLDRLVWAAVCYASQCCKCRQMLRKRWPKPNMNDRLRIRVVRSDKWQPIINSIKFYAIYIYFLLIASFDFDPKKCNTSEWMLKNLRINWNNKNLKDMIENCF